MKYDLIVFGAGTSGIACAYTASKLGIKTLLAEYSDVAGGTITQGLVTPSMNVNTEGINTDFIADLRHFADKYSARHTYSDGNKDWYNPELLKIVFDNMLQSVNCDVLYGVYPLNISSNNSCFKVNLDSKMLSLYIESNYIVDATANGKIFKILNSDFQKKNKFHQAPSLRFILSGINIKKFADWLEEYDKDRSVTTIERTEKQIYLSTACTWDKNREWALRPLFDEAVINNDLEYEDTAYFQVFSMPSMPDALNFNCPRIFLGQNEDIENPFVYSKALIQGRKRVYRLYNFCKKYLSGFENSYISHISDMLGIRESNRVKCKYTFVKDDIVSPKNFNENVLACDYPIDIHSNKESNDKLLSVKNTYYLPLDALISNKYENLYGIGRIISSDFESQAALRTQMSCFSMGEAAAKDIYKKINQDKKQ